jgi:Zn-dependent peptidase ImmA (M78 family)
VELKAEETFRESGGGQVPVNPIAIAHRLGFSVNAAVFHNPAISGRTLVRNGEVRIDVKSSDSPAQRRFTIAHEIGHALLHLEGIENGEISDTTEFLRQESGEQRPVKEVEADRFAAALLMPRDQVLAAIESSPLDVDALSSRFNVSTGAMKMRLEHLRVV